NEIYRQRYWAKFKDWCHEAVVRGYRLMLENPSDFKQWKEEKISARLLREMRKDEFLVTKNISVAREHELEDTEIIYGEREASEADRIDFSFESTWQQKEYITYFGEAKNLSANSWHKEGGSAVKAWNQREYYLKTGIQGLLIGKYQRLEGFLIGYIVNGSAKQNSENLNKHIEKRRANDGINLLEIQEPTYNYDYFYFSKNIVDQKQIDILHIFLEFDNS
ncbi:MAG: hypothetical protein AAGG68_31380, partial [Bacteroidota bacterium]